MNTSAYITIGTGRSGTSLVMQALDKLGVTIPGDQVPPSENNLRGTGEAIVVRDRMVALNKSLGQINGFRPTGWEESPPAQETLRWLTEYLTGQAAKAGPSGFAVKFPLASIFLPLWQHAACSASVELKFIWATRRATGTIQSLIAAYGSSTTIAQLRYIQRNYYILRDAPDDTVMLPYEGWSHDPDGQVAALAEMTGVTDADLQAAARAVFSDSLDHSREQPDMELPDPIAALDEKMRGERCRLDAVFDRQAVQHLKLMTDLADLLTQLQPRSHYGDPDEEHEMRLRLLSQLSAESERAPEMKEEIEILAQRIREVSAENRRLKAARGPERSDARPRKDKMKDVEPNSALVQQLQAQLQSVSAERDAVRCRLDEREAALADTQDKLTEAKDAYARLTGARDSLEQEVESRVRLQLQDLESREAKFRKQAEKLSRESQNQKNRIKTLEKSISEVRAQRDALLNSRSWKLTAPIRKTIDVYRSRSR